MSHTEAELNQWIEVSHPAFDSNGTILRRQLVHGGFAELGWKEVREVDDFAPGTQMAAPEDAIAPQAARRAARARQPVKAARKTTKKASKSTSTSEDAASG